LDEVQAAVLRVKLRYLSEDNARRRAIAATYDWRLAETGLDLPATRAGAAHVWHLYVVRTPARDALQRALAERGVGSLVHYPVPVHQQPAYAGRRSQGPLPHSEGAAREVLSLPMFPELVDADLERVSAAVKESLVSVA
jgi:dTDP-4-amino-4,6-dideoxygalactose transaminase